MRDLRLGSAHRTQQQDFFTVAADACAGVPESIWRFSSNSALSISPLAKRRFKTSMADDAFRSPVSSFLPPQQHSSAITISYGTSQAIRLESLKLH